VDFHGDGSQASYSLIDRVELLLQNAFVHIVCPRVIFNRAERLTLRAP
jgi:hypothetical protein